MENDNRMWQAIKFYVQVIGWVVVGSLVLMMIVGGEFSYKLHWGNVTNLFR